VAGVFGGSARCHARRTAHAPGRRGGGNLALHGDLAGHREPGLGTKKSIHDAERDTARVVALRHLFLEALPQEGVTRVVFVLPDDLAQARLLVDQAVHLYNEERSQLSLSYLIPNQVHR